MSKANKAGKSPVDLLNAAKAAKAEPEKTEPTVSEDAINSEDADFAGLADTPIADSDPEPTDALPGEDDEPEISDVEADEPKAQAAATKSEPSPEKVVFVSRDPENRCFTVNLIRAGWHGEGNRIRWRVPADQAESFRNHPHVKSGRIVELKV